MGDYIKALIETQVIGAFRVALTMPLEHVLDRIKTYKQSKQGITYIQSYLDIKGARGLIGLYDGFYPSFLRNMVKQYYRWPMMIFIPSMLNDHIHNQSINKIITGASIGLFESCIITPFERLKTLKMTSMATGFGYLKYITLESIYVGFRIQTTRQVVSWTNYLYWDHKVRYALKTDPGQPLSIINSLIASTLSSILNILAVHPFDTIKTLVQMEENHNYRKISLYQSFKIVYQNYGLAGLYAGWQARIIAYFCQALLTTPTIDYLERNYGISKSKKQQ
ncbi:unnamed protein product [Paramecium primaurelia]|uniref:Mitochondrial carrier protein n=1 Tax=Paramecium primaurelia TaxID=5886 RepID=A0A8S1LD86_PARPR|nr:unnamed protein product [Paramecium primaurelia]